VCAFATQLKKHRDQSRKSPQEGADRASDLLVLREFASQFKAASAGRVKDRAKEGIGAKPAFYYGPRAPPLTGSISTVELGASAPQHALGSNSQHSAATTELLFRPHTVVFIRGQRGQLFVAELLEALTQTTNEKGDILVNILRLECRYFVPTREIFSWPAATAFWKQHGIADEATAHARADASDGIHYSSEGGKDRVTHSTILGAFNICERQYLWSSLHSFAVSPEQLAVAEEMLSDGGKNAELEQVDERMEAEAAAARLARREQEAKEAAARDAAAEERKARREQGRLQQEAEVEQRRAARERREGKQVVSRW